LATKTNSDGNYTKIAPQTQNELVEPTWV